MRLRRVIYSKIRSKGLSLSLLIGIVFLATHFSPVPRSYDLGGHLARIDLLMRYGYGWTQAWYNGYPLLRFYPPLYHSLMLPVAYFSFELVRPLSYAISGFVASFSMYSYSKRYISANRALASSLLFVSGWWLYIVHISGNMPQAMASGLVPLFFGKLEDSLEGQHYAPVSLIASAILLLHHNTAFVVFMGSLIIFYFRRGNIKNIVLGSAFSLLITAFWLFPAVYYLPSASFDTVSRIGSTGIISHLFPFLTIGLAISVKLIGSLKVIMEYKQHLAIMAAGVVLSVEIFTGYLENLPLFSDLIAYRFYLLSAFSASFLASNTERNVLITVLLISVLSTGYSLSNSYDAGYADGQVEAYEYLEDENVSLLYDSANSDLRVFSYRIHGKDLADGWSIESTALRPGIMRLGELEENRSLVAVEFLERWGVSHVMTYERYDDSVKLRNILERSAIYSRDTCYSNVCVFSSERTFTESNYLGDGRYKINASDQISIPYFGGFNGSKNMTDQGFLKYSDKGNRVIGINKHPLQPFSKLVSVLSLLLLLILWRREVVGNLRDSWRERL